MQAGAQDAQGDNALAELLLELGNAHHFSGQKNQALQTLAGRVPKAQRAKNAYSLA